MLWGIGEVNVEQEDCNALCPGDKTRLALRHTGVLHFGTCGHRRRCPGRSTDRQGSDAAPRGGDRPMTLHYFESRVTLPQFLQLGLEYGRFRPTTTLYLCGSTWTNSPTCGPLH